jgi:hypothetical protein
MHKTQSGILRSSFCTLHLERWSWCNSSIAPRDGAGIGANPFGHPNFPNAEYSPDILHSSRFILHLKDGPKLIVYPPPIRRAYRSWRKPWRSGFDSRHWSASVRSRHLSIRSPRSSTAREHPDLLPGDVGSIPTGSAIYDGPLSLGYR